MQGSDVTKLVLVQDMQLCCAHALGGELDIRCERRQSTLTS